MSTVTKTRFVIAVPNLKVSSAFYRDVLGFKVDSSGGPGWLIYTSGNCTIMAGECQNAIPPSEIGDHSYFAYLEVPDVDVIHRSVIAAGGKTCQPIRTEPWGMRIRHRYSRRPSNHDRFPSF